MTGSSHCACRDCMEIASGGFCLGCKEAGCPSYQGQPGMSQECQQPDAYGGNEGEPSESWNPAQ